MNDLYSSLQQVAADHPETRKHLVPLFRKYAALDVWDTRLEGRSPAGKPLPPSKYDRLPKDQRPFDWATPGRTIEGEFPEPWRVAKTEATETWLHRLFPQHLGSMGLYTDTEGVGLFRGLMQIYVGIRDNRNPDQHSAWLQEMYDSLKSAHWPVRQVARQGMLRGFYLVDDVPRNTLK